MKMFFARCYKTSEADWYQASWLDTDDPDPRSTFFGDNGDRDYYRRLYRQGKVDAIYIDGKIRYREYPVECEQEFMEFFKDELPADFVPLDPALQKEKEE
jgi:hypothetical protein